MAAVFGYSFMIIQLRRRQRQINGLNRMRVVDYGALEKGTRTSFLITATHFVLYVPTILVRKVTYVLRIKYLDEAW